MTILVTEANASGRCGRRLGRSRMRNSPSGRMQSAQDPSTALRAGYAESGVLGKLVLSILSRLQPAAQEMRAAPAGLRPCRKADPGLRPWANFSFALRAGVTPVESRCESRVITTAMGRLCAVPSLVKNKSLPMTQTPEGLGFFSQATHRSTTPTRATPARVGAPVKPWAIIFRARGAGAVPALSST